MELMTTRDRGIGIKRRARRLRLRISGRRKYLPPISQPITFLVQTVSTSKKKKAADNMIVLNGPNGEQDCFIKAKTSGNESRFFNVSFRSGQMRYPRPVSAPYGYTMYRFFFTLTSQSLEPGPRFLSPARST